MPQLRFILVLGIVCTIVGDLGLSIGDANSCGRFEDGVYVNEDHSVLGKDDHLRIFNAFAPARKRKRIACSKDSAAPYESVLRPLNNRHWRRHMRNTENKKYILTDEERDNLFGEQPKTLPDNEFAQQSIGETPDINSKKTQRYTPSENTDILFEITKRLLNNGNLTENIRNVNSEVHTEEDAAESPHLNPITKDSDHIYLLKINPQSGSSPEQQQQLKWKQKQKKERHRKLLSSLSRMGDGLVFIETSSGKNPLEVTQRPETQKQEPSSSGPIDSIANFGNTIMHKIGLGRYDKPIPSPAKMKPNTRPQIGKVALGSNIDSLLYFENDENFNNNENYRNDRDCAVPFLTEDLSENSLDYVTSKNGDNNS